MGFHWRVLGHCYRFPGAWVKDLRTPRQCSLGRTAWWEAVGIWLEENKDPAGRSTRLTTGKQLLSKRVLAECLAKKDPVWTSSRKAPGRTRRPSKELLGLPRMPLSILADTSRRRQSWGGYAPCPTSTPSSIPLTHGQIIVFNTYNK